MDLQPVSFRSPLSSYERQAEGLFAGHRAADPAAIDLFHRKHPRFLDEKIKWRPKFIADSEIRDAPLSLDDARLAIARHYDFLDWPSLVERGARLDIRDTIWHGTPLGWAIHGGGTARSQMADCLRSLGATD